MIEPKVINSAVWSRLTKIHKSNKLSGAYLFVGSKDLGKIEMAFEFIALEEKLQDKKELIKSGAHPDVIIVQPEIEEKKGRVREKQISIEKTQEALKRFSYFPQEASKKILLINKINKLTLSAANSLLKTIEELSENQLVILTVSGEGGALDTIKSRCQRVYFNLKSEKEIKEFILNENTDSASEVDLKNADLIKDVTFLARGRIKEAQKLLGDENYQKLRIEKLNQFRKALRGDLKTGFQIADEDTRDREVFYEFLTDWIYYLNSFIKQNIFEKKDLKVQKKIFQIFKKLDEAREVLRSNPNTNARLLMENFFVQIK